MRLFKPRVAVAVMLLAPLASLPVLVHGGAEPKPLRLAADDRDKDLDGAVIVLNNCDVSKGGTTPDNEDNVINGEDDWEQLTPVWIRRLTTPPTGELTLKLVNYEPQASRETEDGDPLRAREKVRVFNAQRRAILGPKPEGNQYTLSPGEAAQLARGDLLFKVEGLKFGVTARLVLFQGHVEQDALVLRVAPFLLLPHTQRPVFNMVCTTNPTYLESFKAQCKVASVPVRAVPSGDPWIEDELQWGYTATPRCTMPVALHLNRVRGRLNDGTPGRSFDLFPYVREKLIGAKVGYCQLFHLGEEANSLAYGGNLEVTPPTAKYPFGRVYFGSQRRPSAGKDKFLQRPYDAALKEFFERQGLQDPIELWTNWMVVGHVDEYVSFVPSPKARSGFVMLLASPDRALRILEEQERAEDDLPRSQRELLDEKYGFFKLEREGSRILRVTDLLHVDRAPGRMDFLVYQSLRNYNAKVDAILFGENHGQPADPRSIKGSFVQALDLPESDIYEVPVLFGNHPSAGDRWASVALTPGMVNLSSMDRYCLVPDPFLAQFRRDVEKTFTTIGLERPLWINDWHLHANDGEVHCGSNMQREPFARHWWQDKKSSLQKSSTR